ncbi:MAG: hypothetical protein PF495_06755 [Spirochaetales bacterium]|jgi:hypothetical protein|nr:hypothetical protein [Spirochaetales bacterium]
MTNENIDYIFLAKAGSNEKANKQVLHFLGNTDLITYDTFEIHAPGCMNGSHQQFWPCIEDGLDKNMAFSEMVLAELQTTGVSTMNDLLQLAPGYPSKLLHILTHMIDGFISVDSCLYNLVEDAHTISINLNKAIQAAPEQYWLIPVITGVVKNSLLHPAPKQPKQ